MTIGLRPHHLLCMLTYAGEGYGPDFVANYDGVATRLARGEDIVIVEGPDDICAPLLDDDEPHCLCESVAERDRLAADDIARVLDLPISRGSRMSLRPALLERMRSAFAEGRTRSACVDCEWRSLCDAIVADDFERSRVRPTSIA